MRKYDPGTLKRRVTSPASTDEGVTYAAECTPYPGRRRVVQCGFKTKWLKKTMPGRYLGCSTT